MQQLAHLPREVSKPELLAALMVPAHALLQVREGGGGTGLIGAWTVVPYHTCTSDEAQPPLAGFMVPYV